MESTTQLINETFVFVLLFASVVSLYAYLTHRQEEDGPTNSQRIRAALAARYLTSSGEAPEVREVIHVPVAEPAPNQYDTHPAFDITQSLDQDALIRLLCYQIDERTGKLYSANKIADFIGGTRADVLAVVRDERSSEISQPYQSEPVRTIYSRDDKVVGYVDNRPIKQAANGEEYVMIRNQYIPRGLYVAGDLELQPA